MSKVSCTLRLTRMQMQKVLDAARKEIRARNKRNMTKAMRIMKEAVVNATPVHTGATRKAWRTYSNIEKDGFSAYGSLFIDKNRAYYVFKSKRGKFKFSRGQKEGWVKVQPWYYIYKVENRKQFAKNAAKAVEAEIIQVVKNG